MAHRTRLLLVVSAALLFLIVAVAYARQGAARSACSDTPAGLRNWNAVCYRSRIPRQLLVSAPFSLVDPKRVVASVTALQVSAIYVARLGSDDPNPGHPLGPLMAVGYVFGTLPPQSGAHHTSRSYVTVWEDGYKLFNQACGGDNAPSLGRQSRSLWSIDFGACPEVRIVVTPTRPGSYGLTIRTYQLAVRRDGTPIPGQRRFVANGGFTWKGNGA